MGDNNNNDNIEKLDTHIVYLGEENEIKTNYVILIKKTPHGIEYTFPDSKDVLFLPWARILKIKYIGAKKDD